MKKVEDWLAYGVDFGKYLVDASKVILGVAVIAPLFDKNEPFTSFGALIAGTVASLATVFAGIYLRNLKK